MVVRFVPADEPVAPRPDRVESDLAEVIDFRSRLKNLVENESLAEPERDPEPEDEANIESASLITHERPKLSVVTRLHSGDSSHQVPTGPSGSDTTARPLPKLRAVSHGQRHQLEESLAEDGAQPGASTDLESAGGADSGPQNTAYEDGVKILARKAMSRGELGRDLLRQGHDSLDVEILLDEFCERLYLDDTSLARTLAERLRERKGASKAHIRQKLRERQLTDSVITVVLDELDDAEEYALLKEAASDRARKMSGLDRATAERRLIGFLARRGWSGESVHRAVKEALDSQGGSSSVRFR